jgi:hypothetical protein
MGALVTAGTIAAALIAIGTLLRWAFRRTIRTATWMSAAIRLPTVVSHLARSVTDLSMSVTDLAESVDRLHHRSDAPALADH